jgi:hypothetical protein
MMEIAAAIEILAQVLNTVTNAVAQATQISSIVKGAQAQGRTTLTEAEWTIVNQANAQSRQALVDAITKALAGG